MPYTQLDYHLVWHTWKSEPLITDAIEQRVHGILHRCATKRKARVYAVGGIEDHVHLVVSIPPSMAVARFVGQVKGASSREIENLRPFAWQKEYGAFTVSRRDLPRVIEYVRNQRQHHGRGTTVTEWERSA